MSEENNTLPSTTFAHVASVTNVNHKPHPFMVGTKNVVEASDHHGGMLTQAVMDKVGCEWQDRPHGPYCGLSTSAHTNDKVAFVKFTAPCTEAEASAWLKSLVPWAEAEKIDGFAFIETGIRPTKS